MATGGTGDILTGMVAGFIAQIQYTSPKQSLLQSISTVLPATWRAKAWRAFARRNRPAESLARGLPSRA